MKICLINPPQLSPINTGTPVVFQPLSLAYLAAAIEKKHNVSILDANAEGWKNVRTEHGLYRMGLENVEIEERLRKIAPDVVGITIPFSLCEETALNAAMIAKKINPKIITVVGGAHATVRPGELLSRPEIDFVVIGEGEVTFVEFLENIEKGSPAKHCNTLGLGYKDQNDVKINLPRPFIKDLDALPFPARNLLPMELYFNAMRVQKGSRQSYVFSDRWTTMITSRGCPYNCIFCSIHTIAGKKFRARSPENVVAEIEEVVNKFNIKHINFEDDNLTLDKERIKKILDLIIDKGIKISWSAPNGIRADALDEEIVKKMKQSGCKRVFVAPESGVKRVITEIIDKKMDLGAIENAVKWFNKYGITVDGSFVIGLIGETKKEIWETIRYAKKLKRMGMKQAGIHLATPLFGTRLYEEARRKKYLKLPEIESKMLVTNLPLLDTPEWKGEEVRRIQQWGNWVVNENVAGKLTALFRLGMKAIKNIINKGK